MDEREGKKERKKVEWWHRFWSNERLDDHSSLRFLPACEQLRALGFNGKRNRTREFANSKSLRGSLRKVEHLITVELKSAAIARMAAEAARRSVRPPVLVRHAIDLKPAQ